MVACAVGGWTAVQCPSLTRYAGRREFCARRKRYEVCWLVSLSVNAAVRGRSAIRTRPHSPA
jgi:hypothetical protein